MSTNKITVGQEGSSPIEIFYKDWGSSSGRPIVFSHGWPLNSDAWDEQLLFFGEKGFRAVAHDRRGHGRSSQTWTGNDMDTYADDLAKVLDTLDLKDVVLIGHSTGGGEVTRYVARHGTSRVSKLVLVGAVTPCMLQSESNPNGVPMSAFDSTRDGVRADRSKFFLDLTMPFYNYNRPGANVSEGVRQAFWVQGMHAGLKSALDCITAFSETDFTDDLKKIDIPVLICHGEDDQIVPVDISAKAAAKVLKHPTLKLYPGGSHGLAVTERDAFHRDLLEFIQS